MALLSVDIFVPTNITFIDIMYFITSNLGMTCKTWAYQINLLVNPMFIYLKIIITVDIYIYISLRTINIKLVYVSNWTKNKIFNPFFFTVNIQSFQWSNMASRLVRSCSWLHIKSHFRSHTLTRVSCFSNLQPNCYLYHEEYDDVLGLEYIYI